MSFMQIRLSLKGGILCSFKGVIMFHWVMHKAVEGTISFTFQLWEFVAVIDVYETL